MTKDKSLFKCRVSCSGPAIVDDVIYVIASDIQAAIQAADHKARQTSGRGARVISAEELTEEVVEAKE